MILGNGPAAFEKEIEEIARLDPARGSVCFLKGYDTDLARKIYAGGDFFLIPSRYEPCGLTDFIAQLHGNIPIVHPVGGLVKVEEEATGFVFSEYDGAVLAAAMEKAVRCWEDKKCLRNMQGSAIWLIERRYTWKIVKEKYLQLYKKAKESRGLIDNSRTGATFTQEVQ